MAKHLLGFGMIQQWLRNSTDPSSFLAELKKKGVDFIEMGVNKKEWEMQLPWMGEAFEIGMKVSFHFPYYAEYSLASFKDSQDNSVSAACFELLSRIADFCRSRGYTGIVNLHGADAVDKSKEELYLLTVEFLRWIRRNSMEYNWPLEFVVENLPHNPAKKKYGEVLEELVPLKKACPFLRGFCWDLGHYTWNLHSGAGGELPKVFLKNVTHLHVHDFKDLDANVDHCPLKFDVVKWHEYLKMLSSRQLHVVLELDFRNSHICGDAYTDIFESISKLKGALSEL